MGEAPSQPPRLAPPVVRAPGWMSAALWLAAIYNILYGTVAVALPNQLFEWAKMAPPNYPQIWQFAGLLIGLLGIGYGIAAMQPYRHWSLVLVGLLGKVLGPIGMAIAVAQHQLPLEFAYQLVPNDLIWIIPFCLILRGAWRAAHPRPERASRPSEAKAGATAERTHGARSEGEASASAADAGDDEGHGAGYKAAESAALAAVTRQASLHRGQMLSALSLRELSDKTPTLVVFLRHLGCTFCREALADIATKRKEIEARGVAIVLVHMSEPKRAVVLFEKYGLNAPEPIWHTSDPEQKLYQAFELGRGRFGQLFGFAEISRFLKVGIGKGHFVGLPQGDGRQLGGAFLYYRRRVIKAARTTRASDPTDLSVAACPIDAAQVPPPPPPLSRRATSAS